MLFRSDEVSGKIGIVEKDKRTVIEGKADLPTTILQTDDYIKKYIEKNGGRVDYIHGNENLQALVSSNQNSVGITFDKMDKSDLFKYVSEKGALPRKTFSMGEGIEKRYYLEGRKIVK